MKTSFSSNINRKTVLITGASGGIGKAAAELLAMSGWSLILQGNRRISELHFFANELHKKINLRQTINQTFCQKDGQNNQDPPSLNDNPLSAKFLNENLSNKNSLTENSLNENLLNENQNNAQNSVNKTEQNEIDIQILEADLSTEKGQNRLMEEASFVSDGKIDALINAAGLDLMSQDVKYLSFEEKLALIFQLDVNASVRLSRWFGALCNSAKFQSAENNLSKKTAVSQTDPSSRLNNSPFPNILDEKNEITDQNFCWNRPENSGERTIILFGWDGTERGMRGETAQLYAIAKGAVRSFALSLAKELAPKTRVCVVSPGWIRTTWGAKNSPGFNETAQKESLLNRWGTPKEVAEVVQFLISSKASFLNAVNIPVNGGHW